MIGAVLLTAALAVAGCGGPSGVDIAPASTSSTAASAWASPSTPSTPSDRASASGSGPATALVAAPDALGPAAVGRPLGAFARALGRSPVPVAAGEGDSGCWVRSLQGLTGVTVMTLKAADGTVSRVDVTTRNVRTEAGVGVGSTTRQVRAAYPRLTVEPHKYVDGGSCLTVVGTAGHDLLFETDPTGVVTRFRFGESEPVSWVEGCA